MFQAKKYFLVFLIAGFTIPGFAQVTFQKTIGGMGDDTPFCVKPTSDSGFIVVGYTDSFIGAGGRDVYVVKTNKYGDTLWTRTYGGSGSDAGIAVQQTFDGNYIVAGHTTSFGAGGLDAYLLKIDAVGNLLWSKTYGGSLDEYIYSVQQTSDSGFVIAGNTNSFGVVTVRAYYIVRTDKNGDTLWTKRENGFSTDWCSSIRQTTDKGFIICGSTQSGGPESGFFAKTDSMGNVQWANRFQTNASVAMLPYYIFQARQTSDGGYVISGIRDNASTGRDNVYVIKTDASGNATWSKMYGTSSATSYDSYATCIEQTNDGGYIIGGTTQNFTTSDDMYIIRLDLNGDTVWTKRMGGIVYEQLQNPVSTLSADLNRTWVEPIGSEFPQSFIATSLTSSFGAGVYDYYLVKMDANGNSGCNEYSTGTVVTSVVPALVNLPTTFIATPTIVINPLTITGIPASEVSTLCTTVGINDVALTENEIDIFPNPVNAGQLFLGNLPENEKAEIEIYNMRGQLIMEEHSKNVLDIEKLESGLYLLRYVSDKRIVTRKFCVE